MHWCHHSTGLHVIEIHPSHIIIIQHKSSYQTDTQQVCTIAATNQQRNDAPRQHDERRNDVKRTTSHDASVMTSPSDLEPSRDVSRQTERVEQMDVSPPVEGAVGGAPDPEGDRTSQGQNVVGGEGGV